MRRGVRPGMSPFKVGVLALLGVVVFTWLGFTKFRVPFRPHYEVQAVFRSAASTLGPGSPVRIAGVEVGRVVGLEPGPGGTAVATLRLKDKGRPLHHDATLKIRPRLFLEGNFFVDVRPGTPAAGEVADGGTIPVGQTAVAVQVDEVLGALRKDSRDDLRQTIAGLAAAFDDGAAEAVNRSFRDWAPAFSGTAILAEAARGRRPGDLTRFVRAQSRISGALAARDGDLAGLVTNFATTVRAIADVRPALGQTLRSLDRTLTTAPPALADIRSALPALSAFAADLGPALRVAPGAIDDTRPFVRMTSALLAPKELPALVIDLRPAVAGVRALQPSLRSLLDRVRPIASCVSRNVVPPLNQKLDDGALSVDRTVWQEIAGFAVGLNSAAGNFDANGTQIRYHAGGGENLVSTALPGVGDLVSLTPEPLLGARPRYTPNQLPPFAPEAPCAGQDPPDLRAEAAPAPSAQRRVGLTPRKRAGAVRAAQRRLAGLDTRAELLRALRVARRDDRGGGR